ncbi:branched-chain amino acid transport system II carrier protein [Atopomonas sediminilitoris]|uniref:branched-chain amino acid transport system II carrier protein n=1 Tax=Atopomonas sediminilitoris TaxID=2919919 RepID=UPI001F4E1E43|nr:branched-chain amino acid transport system II carrier protein [Atopomonas sediminilitoris]MCJ8168991.1 branched-chain amino acid transport system II carrier protein [Atopomonas sediminilitoris]
MNALKSQDILALGFMTFALFLGAGNIIFPPAAGLAAGTHVWSAAAGFLLTAVGLPLLTLLAIARVGGGMAELTAPLGRIAAIVFGVAVYLTIGPLFATPRTAVVSFEMGVAPFVGNSAVALALYTAIFFASVLWLSLRPGELLDRVGKFITPILLLSLVLLGGAAVLFPAGEIAAPKAEYLQAPAIKGFLEGYLTMDTLGALVFGIVITTAIRDRGVSNEQLISRYTVYAGVIAAIGLALVYVAFFYLGAASQSIAADAPNGVAVLTAYVQHVLGTPGLVLLACVIILACLTTAVGLLTACGEYFAALLPVSYRTVIISLAVFSFLVANQGLTQLISVSIPVLVGLYPLAIALLVLNLLKPVWQNPALVFRAVMLTALVFGVCDGLAVAGLLDEQLKQWLMQLPLGADSLGWLLPVCVVLVAVTLIDRLSPAGRVANA